MTGSGPKRANARGDEQRGHILAAALELMAEEGEAAVTPAATAVRAGVSRGTVYYHFANRAALVAATRESLQAQLSDLAHTAHHFRNPYGLALRLAVEDETIIRSRIRNMLEHGPLRDPRTVNLLARLDEMAGADELQPDLDPQAVALIAAALDLAGLMTIQLGHTKAERRERAARLSATWEKLFVRGALLRGETSGG